MWTKVGLVLTVLGLAWQGVAVAADAAAGAQDYAKVCVACHGPEGHSATPTFPNLAGQKDEYLVEQLKAFRDGSRKNPIMQPLAEQLSDTDIANLAAYLAAVQP